MDMTTREAWTLVHGMGFGGLYLLACTGALVALHRRFLSDVDGREGSGGASFLRAYLLVMTVLAWATVLSGTYVIYPWYRAVAPPGTANLAGYPQALLRASAATSGWHTLGMEWKEHVAWITPITITMATAIVWQYGRELREQIALRRAVVVFVAVSFAAAGIAGFFGAMLDKVAPVAGGPVLHLLSGGRG